MRPAAARKVVDAAQRAAEGIGVPTAVAVIDAGKNPVVLLRMDGAFPVAVDTLIANARTAIQCRSTGRYVYDSR